VRTFHPCAPEKFDWVKTHFGVSYARHMIFVKDKTLVYADILIDDRPQKGRVKNPVWTQYFFDHPRNVNINGNRIKHWKEWQKIMEKDVLPMNISDIPKDFTDKNLQSVEATKIFRLKLDQLPNDVQTRIHSWFADADSSKLLVSDPIDNDMEREQFEAQVKKTIRGVKFKYEFAPFFTRNFHK
jgi:hypothetical protein